MYIIRFENVSEIKFRNKQYFYITSISASIAHYATEAATFSADISTHIYRFCICLFCSDSVAPFSNIPPHQKRARQNINVCVPVSTVSTLTHAHHHACFVSLHTATPLYCCFKDEQINRAALKLISSVRSD